MSIFSRAPMPALISQSGQHIPYVVIQVVIILLSNPSPVGFYNIEEGCSKLRWITQIVDHSSSAKVAQPSPTRDSSNRLKLANALTRLYAARLSLIGASTDLVFESTIISPGSIP